MERSNAGIYEFEGLAHDVHRAKLETRKFQVDLGGDRFEERTWRRRRGNRHTDVAKVTSAITTLIGFELADSYGLLLVEGANAHGNTDVAEQSEAAAGGFGRGAFGRGGFGS